MNKGLNIRDGLVEEAARSVMICQCKHTPRDKRPVSKRIENEDGSITIIENYVDAPPLFNRSDMPADAMTLQSQIDAGVSPKDVSASIGLNTIDAVSYAQRQISSIANDLNSVVNSSTTE